MIMDFLKEEGEEYRKEFEIYYGRVDHNLEKPVKNKGSDLGEWLDMNRFGDGEYRSMVTKYAWVAFRQGKGVNLKRFCDIDNIILKNNYKKDTAVEESTSVDSSF